MAIKANTDGLKELALKFRAADPAVKKAYREELKEIAKTVADDARERIADKSPPTAAAIKVGARGANKVTISAGKRKIASLLEGDGHPGEWRHPLFGDREHWYTEERHPYLWPAWEANKQTVSDRMGRAIHDAMESVDLASEED